MPNRHQPEPTPTAAETDEDRLYEQEYERGSNDGYAGNAITPVFGHPLRVQDAYREGYRDGQAAYRRTLEGRPGRS